MHVKHWLFRAAVSTAMAWIFLLFTQLLNAQPQSPAAEANPADAPARENSAPVVIRHHPEDVSPPLGGLFSPGVEVPSGFRTLYISGQAGVTTAGGIPQDPESQLDLAWENVKKVLSAAGMGVADLVKVTCYLRNPEHVPVFAQSAKRHLGNAKPSISAPVVRQLRVNEWHFEIEAIAASPWDEKAVLGKSVPRSATEESSRPSVAPRHSPDRQRRLLEMYKEQDKIERQREENKLKNLKSISSEVRAAPRTEEAVAAKRQQAKAVAATGPAVIRSSNGRADITLDVAYDTFDIGKDRVRLRSYNNHLVGPIIRAKAGDTLFITLTNLLPAEDAPPHEANGHHEWNTTNLHFHGLHVAPQGPTKDKESDNVLLELKTSSPFDPNQSIQKYEVHIPSEHVAGTFWYHAHKHGSVAAQVSSGMCGALIVERDDDKHNLDSVPEVRAAKEEIMVLQQIPYTSNVFGTLGGIEPLSPNVIDNMFGPAQWSKLRRYVTVTGVRIPEYHIAPGEVRRLRLIDAGQREMMQLRIERAPQTTGTGANQLSFYEVAVDGLPTGDIQEMDEIELFPGYRSDVLVRPPIDASGEYYLVDNSLKDSNQNPLEVTGADGSPEFTRWIAKIVVTGTPVKMDLPKQITLAKHRLADIDPATVTGTQYAFYGLNLLNESTQYMTSECDLSQKLDYLTLRNARPYDATLPRLLTLGQTEKWLIGSRNSPLPGRTTPLSVTHPFHIHVNPFLIRRVTRVNPDGSIEDVTQREIKRPLWRDTLAMKQGLTYEIMTTYADFPGSFVDHCHILDHEDNGMMELVTIIDPKASGASSNKILSSIPAANGRPSILFFVKGAFCRHCMAQLIQMASKLSEENVSVSVISASTQDDLRDFPLVPFTLIADPDYKLFRKHGAFVDELKHATIVFDSQGNEVFRDVAEEPLMDATIVIKSLRRASTLSR